MRSDNSIIEFIETKPFFLQCEDPEKIKPYSGGDKAIANFDGYLSGDLKGIVCQRDIDVTKFSEALGLLKNKNFSLYQLLDLFLKQGRLTLFVNSSRERIYLDYFKNKNSYLSVIKNDFALIKLSKRLSVPTCEGNYILINEMNLNVTELCQVISSRLMHFYYSIISEKKFPYSLLNSYFNEMLETLVKSRVIINDAVVIENIPAIEDIQKFFSTPSQDLRKTIESEAVVKDGVFLKNYHKFLTRISVAETQLQFNTAFSMLGDLLGYNETWDYCFDIIDLISSESVALPRSGSALESSIQVMTHEISEFVKGQFNFINTLQNKSFLLELPHYPSSAIDKLGEEEEWLVGEEERAGKNEEIDLDYHRVWLKGYKPHFTSQLIFCFNAYQNLLKNHILCYQSGELFDRSIFPEESLVYRVVAQPLEFFISTVKKMITEDGRRCGEVGMAGWLDDAINAAIASYGDEHYIEGNDRVCFQSNMPFDSKLNDSAISAFTKAYGVCNDSFVRALFIESERDLLALTDFFPDYDKFQHLIKTVDPANLLPHMSDYTDEGRESKNTLFRQEENDFSLGSAHDVVVENEGSLGIEVQLDKNNPAADLTSRLLKGNGANILQKNKLSFLEGHCLRLYRVQGLDVLAESECAKNNLAEVLSSDNGPLFKMLLKSFEKLNNNQAGSKVLLVIIDSKDVAFKREGYSSTGKLTVDLNGEKHHCIILTNGNFLHILRSVSHEFGHLTPLGILYMELIQEKVLMLKDFSYYLSAVSQHPLSKENNLLRYLCEKPNTFNYKGHPGMTSEEMILARKLHEGSEYFAKLVEICVLVPDLIWRINKSLVGIIYEQATYLNGALNNNSGYLNHLKSLPQVVRNWSLRGLLKSHDVISHKNGAHYSFSQLFNPDISTVYSSDWSSLFLEALRLKGNKNRWGIPTSFTIDLNLIDDRFARKFFSVRAFSFCSGESLPFKITDKALSVLAETGPFTISLPQSSGQSLTLFRTLSKNTQPPSFLPGAQHYSPGGEARLGSSIFDEVIAALGGESFLRKLMGIGRTGQPNSFSIGSGVPSISNVSSAFLPPQGIPVNAQSFLPVCPGASALAGAQPSPLRFRHIIQLNHPTNLIQIYSAETWKVMGLVHGPRENVVGTIIRNELGKISPGVVIGAGLDILLWTPYYFNEKKIHRSQNPNASESSTKQHAFFNTLAARQFMLTKFKVTTALFGQLPGMVVGMLLSPGTLYALEYNPLHYKYTSSDLNNNLPDIDPKTMPWQVAAGYDFLSNPLLMQPANLPGENQFPQTSSTSASMPPLNSTLYVARINPAGVSTSPQRNPNTPKFTTEFQISEAGWSVVFTVSSGLTKANVAIGIAALAIAKCVFNWRLHHAQKLTRISGETLADVNGVSDNFAEINDLYTKVHQLDPEENEEEYRRLLQAINGLYSHISGNGKHGKIAVLERKEENGMPVKTCEKVRSFYGDILGHLRDFRFYTNLRIMSLPEVYSMLGKEKDRGKIVLLNEKGVQLCESQAAVAWQNGEYDIALGFCDKGLSFEANSPGLVIIKSQIIMKNNPAEAVSGLQSVSSDPSVSPYIRQQAQLSLLACHILLGDNVNSIKTLLTIDETILDDSLLPLHGKLKESAESNYIIGVQEEINQGESTELADYGLSKLPKAFQELVLGLILENEGDRAGAIIKIELAYDSGITHPVVSNLLLKFYVESNNYSGALGLVGNLIDKAKDDENGKGIVILENKRSAIFQEAAFFYWKAGKPVIALSYCKQGQAHDKINQVFTFIEASIISEKDPARAIKLFGEIAANESQPLVLRQNAQLQIVVCHERQELYGVAMQGLFELQKNGVSDELIDALNETFKVVKNNFLVVLLDVNNKNNESQVLFTESSSLPIEYRTLARGVALKRAGNLIEASKAFKLAYEQGLKDPIVRDLVISTFIESEQHGEAIQFIKDVIENSDIPQIELLSLLCQLYTSQGDWETAIGVAEKRQKEFSSNEELKKLNKDIKESYESFLYARDKRIFYAATSLLQVGLLAVQILMESYFDRKRKRADKKEKKQEKEDELFLPEPSVEISKPWVPAPSFSTGKSYIARSELSRGSVKGRFSEEGGLTNKLPHLMQAKAGKNSSVNESSFWRKKEKAVNAVNPKIPFNDSFLASIKRSP